MDKLTQFSVFLANKPGTLSQVYRELARAKLNIAGLAMMDSTEHGVLRMIVDDPVLARHALRQLNIPFSETEVLAVSVANRPGSAADVCDRLANAHINIGYMYCTTGGRGGKATLVLKVPDIAKAVKVLGSNKFTRRDMRIKLRRPAPTRP